MKDRSCMNRHKVYGLVSKHKAGSITTDEYFRRVIKVNMDHDLPASFRTYCRKNRDEN